MSGVRYKASQFIAAIPGSAGIISIITRRVGCDWNTTKKYVTQYPTVAAAYAAESETPLDTAESVVIRNIQLAAKQQQEADAPVDSADAKWYLTMKGKNRGYATRTELTGKDGAPMELVIVEQIIGNEANADDTTTPSAE
jgi:hypothetical protein